MQREFGEIKKKLSGKFANLYPLYEKFRDRIIQFDPDIKFYLKTIYIVVDSSTGPLCVIFWKENQLEIAVSSSIIDDNLLDGSHLKYKGMEKMLKIANEEDIDIAVNILNVYINTNSNN